jgi:hypothetical protein
MVCACKDFVILCRFVICPGVFLTFALNLNLAVVQKLYFFLHQSATGTEKPAGVTVNGGWLSAPGAHAAHAQCSCDVYFDNAHSMNASWGLPPLMLHQPRITARRVLVLKATLRTKMCTHTCACAQSSAHGSIRVTCSAVLTWACEATEGMCDARHHGLLITAAN